MSKYCMQCGKEIEEKDTHCQYCGASQENSFGVSPHTDTQGKGDMLVPIVAILSVILVAVIVVLNLTVLNNSYKKPLDNIFAALNKKEYDYLEDALPDYIIDHDDYDYDKMEKEFEKSVDLKKFDSDIEFSYDVLDKEPIDDDKLEKIEDKVEKKYDESVDVEQGYEVKIEMTVKIEDKEDSKKITIPVYEIDGKWCITDESFSHILS